MMSLFPQYKIVIAITHTHTTVLLLFWNLSGTTWVSRYQKGKTRKVKTNLDTRDSEWQWDPLGYMQVCTSSQTTTPTSHHSVFLQAGCPSCRPTNSVKALKENCKCNNDRNISYFSFNSHSPVEPGLVSSPSVLHL